MEMMRWSLVLPSSYREYHDDLYFLFKPTVCAECKRFIHHHFMCFPTGRERILRDVLWKMAHETIPLITRWDVRHPGQFACDGFCFMTCLSSRTSSLYSCSTFSRIHSLLSRFCLIHNMRVIFVLPQYARVHVNMHKILCLHHGPYFGLAFGSVHFCNQLCHDDLGIQKGCRFLPF